MKSGIYQINNVETGAFYVGQSVDVQSRLERHAKKLRSGKHVNKHLQASWNKHGEDAFTFEVLELCPERDLNDREQYWLGDMWRDEYSLCYNKTEGGGSGRKSASTRAKMSVATQRNHAKGKLAGTAAATEAARIVNTGRKRTFTKEWKKNITLSARNRPKTPCPHCGLEVTASNMKRWHGDNCKHKEA
jgi:group I intron endonuclease